MLALETLRGTRVVAAAAALDAAPWRPGTIVLRLAADDVLALDYTSDDAAITHITAADSHAIVHDESGFVGCWLSAAELTQAASHIEWHLPEQRPALAQGYVAGVPAKLWLDHQRTLLFCASPYAVELVERLR